MSMLTQDEMNDDFLRRFSELSTDIDQLRLQMNTPSSSCSTASAATTISRPPKSNFFFYGAERGRLPYLSGTDGVDTVFNFLTDLEREFRLRNYELQLPADNTEGWAQYGLQQLQGTARTLSLAKWGTSPNVPWDAFKEWMIKTFYNEKTIRDITREYTSLTYNTYANTAKFHNRFLFLRLLLSFVGRGMTEDAAIRDYQEKMACNNKVALALTQFITAERICERDPKVTLEEIMDYCDTVQHT